MTLTPTIVEATYPDLIEHARAVAIRGNASAGEELRWNAALPPEILGIEVGRYPGYISLGHESCRNVRENSVCAQPEIDKPVLNHFEYTPAGSSDRIIVIVYESLIPLFSGPPREIHVCIDAGGLQNAIVHKLDELSTLQAKHMTP